MTYFFLFWIMAKHLTLAPKALVNFQPPLTHHLCPMLLMLMMLTHYRTLWSIHFSLSLENASLLESHLCIPSTNSSSLSQDGTYFIIYCLNSRVPCILMYPSREILLCCLNCSSVSFILVNPLRSKTMLVHIISLPKSSNQNSPTR